MQKVKREGLVSGRGEGGKKTCSVVRGGSPRRKGRRRRCRSKGVKKAKRQKGRRRRRRNTEKEKERNREEEEETEMMMMGSLLRRLLLLLLLLLLRRCSAAPSEVLPFSRLLSAAASTTTSLVPSPSISLPYHGGPLLLSSSPISIHLLWYGSFSASQKSILSDFLSSFSSPSSSSPSVSSWWRLLSSFSDSSSSSPSPSILPASQFSDSRYSRGKTLKRSDIPSLLQSAISSAKLPPPSSSTFYVLLTSADVSVERFCMSSCGFHDFYEQKTGAGKKVAYGWVGNPASQCPGQCAWPFAVPQYGPPGPPLISPNGDVGMDGLLISFASILAGAATNPFDTGYYQGDPTAPLEAATACAGIYGAGAYPGYPGQLLQDPATKASFNVKGARGREFLLPALWSPLSQKCTPP